MHKEVLNSDQFKLLPFLSVFKKDFGLVGGTAIALQIGHRESIDFDLFSNKNFTNQAIRQKIKTAGFKIEHVSQDEQGEFSLIVNQVRLTFLHYPFPLEFKNKISTHLSSPNLLSLAAMKAYALSRRNKWKDYVDLYFIIRDHYSIKQISKKAQQIFKSEFNEKIFKESLAYFKDIDYSEKVSFLPGQAKSDKEIKESLIKYALHK